MEDWLLPLQQDQPDLAWDLFLARYRKLLFATIRHFTHDADERMDLFAHACERLRATDMARLRRQAESHAPRARFSTWLVVVVRNLVVDWYRQRDGRPRLPASARALTPRQQRLYELVFMRRCPHAEAFGVLESAEPGLPFGTFLADLRVAQRAARQSRAGAPAGIPPEEGEVEALDRVLERAEARRRAAGILASLDPIDRIIVRLHVMEDLPARQVAVIAGLPDAKAVYNRTYRLLARLRELLAAEGLDRDAL